MSVRFLLLALSATALCSCYRMLSAVNPKEIAPAVTEAAQQESCWYGYLPQYAPGFCLVTRQTLRWHDPEMKLGYWRARHPEPPHRLLMEAEGDTLTLYAPYLWDGKTWGRTETQDLYPTLLHDALYHALQGDAPFPRREADLAYLRARRAGHANLAGWEYRAIRCFGGIFNDAHKEQPTILIERTTAPR